LHNNKTYLQDHTADKPRAAMLYSMHWIDRTSDSQKTAKIQNAACQVHCTLFA